MSLSPLAGEASPLGSSSDSFSALLNDECTPAIAIPKATPAASVNDAKVAGQEMEPDTAEAAETQDESWVAATAEAVVVPSARWAWTAEGADTEVSAQSEEDAESSSSPEGEVEEGNANGDSDEPERRIVPTVAEVVLPAAGIPPSPPTIPDAVAEENETSAIAAAPAEDAGSTRGKSVIVGAAEFSRETMAAEQANGTGATGSTSGAVSVPAYGVGEGNSFQPPIAEVPVADVPIVDGAMVSDAAGVAADSGRVAPLALDGVPPSRPETVAFTTVPEVAEGVRSVAESGTEPAVRVVSLEFFSPDGDLAGEAGATSSGSVSVGSWWGTTGDAEVAVSVAVGSANSVSPGRIAVAGEQIGSLADARTIVRTQTGGEASPAVLPQSVATESVASSTAGNGFSLESAPVLAADVAAQTAVAAGRTGTGKTGRNERVETTATTVPGKDAVSLSVRGAEATASSAGDGVEGGEADMAGEQSGNGEGMSGAVRDAREILAVSAGRNAAATRGAGRMTDGEKFQSTDAQELVRASEQTGTRAAKSGENMSAQTTAMLAERKLPDVSSWESGLRPVMELMAGGGGRASGAEATRGTDLGTVRSFAAASVRELLDAVERSREGTNTRFELKLQTRDNEEVSVRVQWREGVVHAQFVTRTPELRDALAREWQAVSPTLAEKGIRFAEPTFEQRDSGGSAQSQAGSSFGQQERQSSSSSDTEQGTGESLSFGTRLAAARQRGTSPTAGTISSVVTESAALGTASSGSLRAWA